jgi:sugar O-acyltransferase (sialic acid O-acetyltransferase NeuD family)
MSRTRTLLIIGCGGHARSVADVALAAGYAALRFADRSARPGETILGFSVFPLADVETSLGDDPYILALGDNHERESALHRLEPLAGRPPVSVVAPDAHVGRDAVIGPGVFIGWGAHVGPCASIGGNSIINTRAVVEHEVVVGVHSHVAVNALLLGRSRIGDRVFLGAGALVRDGVGVTSDVTIGAGAVVTAEVDAPGVYAGVPARLLSTP